MKKDNNQISLEEQLEDEIKAKRIENMESLLSDAFSKVDRPILAMVELGNRTPLKIKLHTMLCPVCGYTVAYSHEHFGESTLLLDLELCPSCRSRLLKKIKREDDWLTPLYDKHQVYLGRDWETKKDEILEKHRKWLNGEDGGVRAILYGMGPNLKYDFSGADLQWACLTGDFSGSNFRGANLNFVYADANFVSADLAEASLCFAEFYKCDYDNTNFTGANLIGSTRWEWNFEYDKSRCEEYFERYTPFVVCDDYDCSIIDKDGNKIPLTKIMDDIENLCKEGK